VRVELRPEGIVLGLIRAGVAPGAGCPRVEQVGPAAPFPTRYAP
jgi:hypothetical protein